MCHCVDRRRVQDGREPARESLSLEGQRTEDCRRDPEGEGPPCAFEPFRAVSESAQRCAALRTTEAAEFGHRASGRGLGSRGIGHRRAALSDSGAAYRPPLRRSGGVWRTGARPLEVGCSVARAWGSLARAWSHRSHPCRRALALPPRRPPETLEARLAEDPGSCLARSWILAISASFPPPRWELRLWRRRCSRRGTPPG